MAKLYGEIAKSALLTLDKSFSRALGQPLDASEVYYSLKAAEDYAKTSAAYVGQKIVVIENNKVTHYSVEDAAGTLKEVGVKPLGDGKSIAVSEAGIVSILGVDSADSLTLPRMKEDKSGIEWVPVSAVVQGDGNDNTTYEITALAKGEGDAAEVYGIKVKTLFNGTAVEGGEFTIEFDVYTKSEADDKFLAKADYTPYDETALANRVTAVENGKADKATTLAGYGIADAYTKDEVNGAIDDAVKGLLGENVADAYDTLKEIQDLLAGTDGEAIDGLIEVADANKQAIEVLNGAATVEGSVDAKIAAAVEPLATTEALNGVKATAEAAVSNEVFNQFKIDNTQAISDAVAAHETAVAQTYATQTALSNLESAVDEAYAKKATTISGYGITDAYTKTEIDNKIGTPGVPAQGKENEEGYVAPVSGTGIFANTYSKAELNAMLDKIEGGSTESAASVARQLDEYKTSNNQRVYDLEVAVGKDVNGEEAATGLFAKVNAAQKQADKGVADAATNAGAIQTINGTLESHTKSIGDNAVEIGKLKDHDAAHTTQYNTLVELVNGHAAEIAKKADATTVNGHASQIGALEAAVKTINETDLVGIRETLNNKANSADVYTKDAVNAITGTPVEGKTLVKMIEEAAAAGTSAADALAQGAVAANTAAIAAIYTPASGEGEGAVAASGVIVNLVKAEETRAVAAEEALGLRIDGIDAILNTVSSEDNITSLKELALWVEEHGTDAAEMSQAITDNANAIAAINNAQTGILVTAKAYSDANLAIAKKYTDDTMVKADDVSIANTNGTFSVKKVSVDALDDTGIELVLFGGNSGYSAPVEE